MPMSSRLQMDDKSDRLALSYNTFFAVVEVPAPSEKKVDFRILTTYKWGDAKSQLNLQLVLRPGQPLETGTGKSLKPGKERIELGEDDLGETIMHNGWILHLPAGATLTWPVFPFNPYRDGPETSLDHAIGIVSVPLEQKDQVLSFSLEIK